MFPIPRAMAQAAARSMMDARVEFLDGSDAIAWAGPASIQSGGMRSVGLELGGGQVPVSVQEMSVFVPMAAPASGFTHVVIQSAPDNSLTGTRFEVKAVPVDTAAPYRLVIVEKAV